MFKLPHFLVNVTNFMNTTNLLVNFPEYVGATRRHPFGIFNCFQLSNMAATKPEIYLFIMFIHKTSAVHLLLGYKIHFTDQIHVFRVGELNGAIKMAPQAIF
jgi:hypothetical protein